MRCARLLVVATLLACGGDSVSPPPEVPPAGLSVAAGDGQVTSPATEVEDAPAVIVRDASGAPLAGVLVTFTIESGGGTLVGDTVRTGTSGTAAVGAWTLGPLPGENVLRASVGMLSVNFRATARLLVPTVTVSGSIVLPPQAKLAAHTLRLVTGPLEVPVDANGGFTAVTEPGAVQVAAAHAPNDNPVLLGWLDGSPEPLSVRSTAQVMAYFDVGAYLSPDTSHRRAVREAVASQLDLTALEAAITAALAAQGPAVTLNTAAVSQARIDVVARLAAGAKRGSVSPVLISPSAEQSGVTVDQNGFRQLTITNNRRRRVVAFVDRVSYRRQGDTTSIPSPLPGAPIRMQAVTPVTSVIGTMIDLLFGNYAWVPVVSPPQPIALFPVDALSTSYRVTVVGPGGRIGASHLSQLQKSLQVRATAETIMIDFLLPLVDQMLNAKNLQLAYSGQKEIDDVVTKFLDLNPLPFFDALGSGDWKGTFNELFKVLFDSEAGRQFFVESILVPYAAEQGLQSIKSLDKVVQRWTRLLASIEVVATTISVAQVLRDIVNTDGDEQWDVTVGGATVKLAPDIAHISQLDTKPFKATVLDASDSDTPPPFIYRWSTTGQFGLICASLSDHGSNYCGTSFDSSRDSVLYRPDATRAGTDQILVEVLVRERGVELEIGEATARVTTYGAKVSISPMQVSIKPGEVAAFNAAVDTDLQDGGVLSYRWTTPGALGSFQPGGTDTEGAINTVRYQAAADVEGSESVTVQVYSTKDGIRRLLGSATGEVLVEPDRPSVISGTWGIAGPVPMDPGRSCITAFISFPIVAGATSYEINAHGFNDPYYWGQQIQATVAPPFDASKPCSIQGWMTEGLIGGSYYLMLSAYAGPDNSISKAMDSFVTRFAGMTVEVTVRY